MRQLCATAMVMLPLLAMGPGPAAALDCPQTRQRSFDSLIERLQQISRNPTSADAAERVCFVSIAGQIIGWFPGSFAEVTSTLGPKVRATLEKASPALAAEAALASSETYTALLAALAKGCPAEMKAIPPATLTGDQGLKCGLIQLPGAPRGLGNATAAFESGRPFGGYDKIAPDPGAGGTTYGRYQLASLAGGIPGFMSALTCPAGTARCLDDSFRALGQTLDQAGGANAAKNPKSPFAQEWARLAQTDRTMQQAQEAYQSLTVWEPMKEFFRTELQIDLPSMSCGLREAAFSVRTQHSVASTKRIFTEAVLVAGKIDGSAIVEEANAWRLKRLGQPDGFYGQYGDVCWRGATPHGYDKKFACAYLEGVKQRWVREATTLAGLKSVECP